MFFQNILSGQFKKWWWVETTEWYLPPPLPLRPPCQEALPPPLHTGSSRPPGTGQAPPQHSQSGCTTKLGTPLTSPSCLEGAPHHSLKAEPIPVHLGFIFTYGVEGVKRSLPPIVNFKSPIYWASFILVMWCLAMMEGSCTGLSTTWISLILRWFWIEVHFDNQEAWNLAHSVPYI